VIQSVYLLFVHLIYYPHVLAQSNVLFFKNTVFLLQFYVTIEQTPCLFSISALAHAWLLPLRYRPLYDSGFFCESESICPHYFSRPLRGGLTDVFTEVGVSIDIIYAFRSLIERVVIQKIGIGVVVKISGLLLIIVHENDGFYITNVIED
jgi:hypothetical protein